MGLTEDGELIGYEFEGFPRLYMVDGEFDPLRGNLVRVEGLPLRSMHELLRYLAREALAEQA